MPYGGSQSSPISDIFKPNPLTVVKTETFPGSSLGAYWTAVNPGNVSISGGILTLAATTSGFYDNHVYHSLPNYDARITMTLPANSTAVFSSGPVMRRQASGACYVVNMQIGGNMALYQVSAAGSPTQIGTIAIAGNPFRDGVTVSMSTTGVSPTQIIVVAKNLSGTVLASLNVVDNTAAVQVAGGVGFASWQTGPLLINNVIIETRPRVEMRKGLIVGFIGDSITFGTGTSGGVNTVPEKTYTSLATLTGVPMFRSTLGVSGTTSADWAAGTGQLLTAQNQFIAAGVNVVSIMLGTNDSKLSVQTPIATYLSNLTGIANQLLTNIPGLKAVIIHCPISHGNLGTDFCGQSLNTLYSFQDQLPGICTGSGGTGILMGDNEGLGYFSANLSQTADNVHPNDTGAIALGLLWARAIKVALGL